jgi:hypothetical protein
VSRRWRVRHVDPDPLQARYKKPHVTTSSLITVNGARDTQVQQPMRTTNASRRAQIIAEIQQLRAELDTRRIAPRPAPASVLSAYQALLNAHYERLDQLDLADDPRWLHNPSTFQE